MIEVRGLTKRYGEVAALTEVGLEVRSGEMTVVLGPSGAGKSTLLRCINRLTKPDAGEVRVDGELLPSGSVLGQVRAAVAAELGLPDTESVVTPEMLAQ
jgi:phosphonate transport system ATP-binding protein